MLRGIKQAGSSHHWPRRAMPSGGADGRQELFHDTFQPVALTGQELSCRQNLIGGLPCPRRALARLRDASGYVAAAGRRILYVPAISRVAAPCSSIAAAIA